MLCLRSRGARAAWRRCASAPFLSHTPPSSPPISGVGHVAVQLLAKVHGLAVVATASPSNTDFLKSIGAASTLDYNSPSFADDVAAAGPFAVVFDLVGGDQARTAWVRAGGSGKG